MIELFLPTIFFFLATHFFTLQAYLTLMENCTNEEPTEFNFDTTETYLWN